VATQDDVRRIALALPDTVEAKDRFAFSVRNKDKEKGFVWVWLERLDPKQARVPNPKVVAIRVPDGAEKQALLATNSKKFFTEDHYNGFPAVLVRLAAIRARELEQLITDAWRTMAPKALVKQFDEEERN
jgi:hypothetical protein